MNNRISLLLLAILSTGIIATSCLSSVSTKLVKKEELGQASKGRNVLQRAWVAQGFDLLSNHKVYKVQLNDHWKGLSGKVGKMWPNVNIDLELKYRLSSFDGQATFLSGKRQGETVGMQSWKYYELVDSTVVFQKKNNKKMVFALAATQYFMELVNRLRNAELITYGGERELDGKTYELVFATWGSVKANKQHDQYLLWIEKETGLVEFCEYTVRDVAFPGSLLSACISFTDYREVEGVKIPFKQFVNMGGPTNNHKKYLHRFDVKLFEFDSFSESVLTPDTSLVKMGDAK